MSADRLQSLLALAQVAVALAGFSAIVVVFRRGESGRWSKQDADRFNGMVVHAMSAVGFCLLPMIVRPFAEHGEWMWKVINTLLAVQIVVHVTGVLRLPTTDTFVARLTVSFGYLVAGVVLLGGFEIASLRPFSAYVFGIVWHIAHSGMLFVSLTFIGRAQVDD